MKYVIQIVPVLITLKFTTRTSTGHKVMKIMKIQNFIPTRCPQAEEAYVKRKKIRFARKKRS